MPIIRPFLFRTAGANGSVTAARLSFAEILAALMAQTHRRQERRPRLHPGFQRRTSRYWPRTRSPAPTHCCLLQYEGLHLAEVFEDPGVSHVGSQMGSYLPRVTTNRAWRSWSSRKGRTPSKHLATIDWRCALACSGGRPSYLATWPPDPALGHLAQVGAGGMCMHKKCQNIRLQLAPACDSPLGPLS